MFSRPSCSLEYRYPLGSFHQRRSGCFTSKTGTTMSTAHLPPELLDHIIDLLYGSQTALRDCCLVSKSWIPHTRTHLFTDVKFDTPRTLRSWKETFQDLSPSPAQYTKTLTIGCIQDVTAADAEPGGWIRGFSRVECLAVRNTWPDGSTISLLPFHGFSPVLKSLHVNSNYLLSPQIFDLTLSFPLLEDLDVISHNLESIGNGNGSCRPSTVIQPSNQPMTGSLKLMQQEGIGFIASRLLSLSGGIHFWKLDLRCDGPDDISSTMALVEGCSHTLEYLEIGSGFLRTPIRYPLSRLVSDFSQHRFD